MENIDKFAIGQFCKKYRVEVLQVSLTLFCDYHNENIKNVSAFESGRANNIKYLFLYASFNEDYKTDFIKKLFNIL